MTTEHAADRFLTIKQVETMIGLRKTAIYDRMNPKSPSYDPRFPKVIKLGKATARWSERAVAAYQAELIAGVTKTVDGNG